MPESTDGGAPPGAAFPLSQRWPYLAGGAAGMVLVVLFLLGALDLVAAITGAPLRAESWPRSRATGW